MSSDSTPVEDEAANSTPEEAVAGTPVEAETPVEEVAVAADEPAVEPPAVEEPAVEEPAVEEPAVEEPAVEEPAVEEPAVEEPAADAPEAGSSLPEITLGEGSIADSSADPEYVPILRGKVDRFGVAMGTGRRKTSVARVRIKEGSGQFLINGRSLDTYFGVERDREMVQAPLKLADKLGKVDISIRVNGGGTTGQTGAIMLGISRALEVVDPALHFKLAEAGYLTRDGRMVERKKYCLRKARRSFQFSKR
jgi:small subunit ribosomal protein S9